MNNDREKAKEIALDFLGQPPTTEDFKYVILDKYTIERPSCYVFFYESSRFLSTDRFEDRLIGNAPILVDRHSGKPYWLGSAKPVEEYISEYESAASKARTEEI